MCTGTDEGESVSIGGVPEFETFEQAEEVGLAWAADVGVQRLFVSTGSREQPLELVEIDQPLAR
jgi:hypothetical protein